MEPFRLVDKLWNIYLEILCNDIVVAVNQKYDWQISGLGVTRNKAVNLLLA